MKPSELGAVRRTGKAPRAVMLWLSDRALPPMGTPECVDMPLSADFALQDWRPFVGLRVGVVGPYEARDRVIEACRCVQAAHAELVVGHATDGRISRDNQVFGAEEFPWPT